MNVEVIRKVTTQYSAEGADQFAQKSRDVGKAHNEMATAVKSSTNVISEQEVAMARMQRQMDIMAQSTKQVTAANDNAARSSAGVISGTQDMGRSLVSTSESILNAVGHLKLLALGAYALFPALRGVVNSGAAQAFALLGPAAGVARTAIAGVVSALSPALSFLARVGAPIGAAVVAWQALNSVINTGAGLLEKYGKAQRDLYGQNVLSGEGSNVTSSFVGAKAIDDATEKLTRFQNDTISQQQVQYATQLGVRLDEAKQKISDFLKVQIDVTNVALKLQNIWVVIVEIIAKVADKLSYIISLIPNLAKIAGAVPGINLPILAMRGINSIAGPAEPSADEAMALARKRLAAGMGGGFTGRWSQDINDLANPPKPPEPKPAVSDAFDRQADAIKKHTATMIADTAAVGLGVAAQEQYRVKAQLIEAQTRADIETVKISTLSKEEQAKEIDRLATAAGVAKEKLAQTNEENKATFALQTVFLTDTEKQIAAVQFALHGNGWKDFMDDGLSATMRVTAALKEMQTLASDFANTFAQGMLAGKSAADALTASANALGKQLTKAGIDNIIKDPTSATGYVEAGVGAVVQLITGNSEKKKQEAAQRAAAAAQVAAEMAASEQRAAQYNTTAQIAGIDTTNLAGALQAFDIQAVQTRLQEAQQKYPQMVALEAQLAAQRLAIQKQFNDQMIAESKKILDYLQGLKTGPNSILNPQDQLAAAQSAFNAQLALAQGGDFTAISGITQVAQTLLDQAKSFFASSSGYANVYNQVTSSLQGVAGRAAQGMAGGGLIGNGVYGVDSVRARFAGGGDIMLAGGEFVNRAGSVNSSTLPTLDYINRTGSMPANDNAAHFDNLSRVVAQGLNGQTAALVERLDTAVGLLQQLTRVIGNPVERRPVPGGPHGQRAAA